MATLRININDVNFQRRIDEVLRGALSRAISKYVQAREAIDPIAVNSCNPKEYAGEADAIEELDWRGMWGWQCRDGRYCDYDPKGYAGDAEIKAVYGAYAKSDPGGTAHFERFVRHNTEHEITISYEESFIQMISCCGVKSGIFNTGIKTGIKGKSLPFSYKRTGAELIALLFQDEPKDKPQPITYPTKPERLVRDDEGWIAVEDGMPSNDDVMLVRLLGRASGERDKYALGYYRHLAESWRVQRIIGDAFTTKEMVTHWRRIE